MTNSPLKQFSKKISEDHLPGVYLHLSKQAQFVQWFDYQEPLNSSSKKVIIVWNPERTISEQETLVWDQVLGENKGRGHEYCGWYGAVSYDWGEWSLLNYSAASNSLNRRIREAQSKPSFWFGYYSNALVYDVATETVTLHVETEQAGLLANQAILFSKPFDFQVRNDEIIRLRAHESFDDYEKKIERIKQDIREGNYYQLNYTLLFKSTYERINPREYFFSLRKHHPVPYSALLCLPERLLLSMSPELLLYSDHELNVYTEPIKGTIAKGNDEKQNAVNRQILEDSEKDKAELVMIVDLVRNDLGKVCETDSIRVLRLHHIKEYNTLYHLTSLVRGKVAKGKSVMDAFLSLFPGGSVTGAPKLSSVRQLLDLENYNREYYTGSAGFFLDNQVSYFNIMIRTLDFDLMKTDQRKVNLYAGGGIVIDSDSKKEYEEVFQKLKFACEVHQHVRE